MKDNVGVIHFHIKSRVVRGLFFMQITFEKCIINIDFEIGKIGIKTTITKL